MDMMESRLLGGEDKALIFAWDRNNNAYDTREMTVSDGDISLADVVFTNSPSACKYSQYIIYNGYLYSIGGYNTVSKNIWKQSINIRYITEIIR